MQSLLFYWRLHAIETWYYSLKKKKPKKQSEVVQSCPTLSDPVDCSLLGSSVHGIFQARVLEWAAIAFSLTPLYFPVKVQVWPLWTLPSAPPSKLHSRGREHVFALFHCFAQSNNEEAKTTIITIYLSLFLNSWDNRGWHRFDGITDSMDMSLSKLQEMVSDRTAFCSPRGHKESDTAERLNNNNKKARKHNF